MFEMRKPRQTDKSATPKRCLHSHTKTLLLSRTKGVLMNAQLYQKRTKIVNYIPNKIKTL